MILVAVLLSQTAAAAESGKPSIPESSHSSYAPLLSHLLVFTVAADQHNVQNYLLLLAVLLLMLLLLALPLLLLLQQLPLPLVLLLLLQASPCDPAHGAETPPLTECHVWPAIRAGTGVSGQLAPEAQHKCACKQRGPG